MHVKKDIECLVHVDDETREQCRKAYVADNEVEMKVCGTCGIRDPDLSYHTLSLDDCTSTDWVVVRPEALSRLCSLPPIRLLRRTLEGPFESADVPRCKFYNMYTPGLPYSPFTFHVVPETIFYENETCCTTLCERCNRKQGKLAKLKPHRHGLRNEDTFDDLYYQDTGPNSAPVSSIGAGQDYERQAFLLNDYKISPPSLLETLVLGTSRVY